MNRTKKTIASLLVTGTAALGVIGCGGSGETTTQAAATQAATQQGTTGQQGAAARGRGGPGAIDSTALAAAAKELGTTTAKLQAAMEAARPSRGSGVQPNSGGTNGSGSGSGDDPMASMSAAVAKTLGTTAAKVQAALADVLPTGGPGDGGGQGGPPSGGTDGTPPSGTPSGATPSTGTGPSTGDATTSAGAAT